MRNVKPLAGAERSSALQRAILVLVMPTSKHHVAPGQLQFLPSSTYRRAQLFERDRFRWSFVEVLGPRRTEMGFLLIGWVLRPDHFHLLIKPEPTASTSRFMQELKKRTAQGILSALSENQRVPRCGKMRARLRLPPTVHADAQFRVGQSRFYPFGVYSEKKRLEKLNYMHGNPVKCGLVASPAQWPWSNFRFYYLHDSSVLSRDRLA
jgi:putative transposase